MGSFELAFEAQIASGTLPGVVLLASDRSGQFNYSKALGVRSSQPGGSQAPLQADTVISVASSTKLLTAIAALQCVENGLLSLDQDVGTVLPEVAALDIISGIDEKTEQPLLTARKQSISLRNLLSHSSGFGYELLEPMLIKWRVGRGEKPWSGKTIEERCTFPLLFEPESSWMYGSGTDWVGKMIERVTGESLETFMGKNIWEPLQLKDTTFWPATKPDLSDRMAEVSMLDPAGSMKAVPLQGFDIVNGLEECLAGGGLYSTANDYMAVLQAVLSEDPRLLKVSSYEELFRDQLSDASRSALNTLLAENEQVNTNCGMNVPVPSRKSWSVGGLLSLDEHPGWMGKNTLQWGGMTSTAWFIDRERGLCGLAAAQVMTFGAPVVHDTFGLYKRQIYDRFADVQNSGRAGDAPTTS